MGVPVVLPSNVPDRISTRSCSLRADAEGIWPGLLRLSSFCISLSVRSMPGGQPSTTAPRAGPCDSPHVVTLKTWPIEFPDIFTSHVARYPRAQSKNAGFCRHSHLCPIGRCPRKNQPNGCKPAFLCSVYPLFLFLNRRWKKTVSVPLL